MQWFLLNPNSESCMVGRTWQKRRVIVTRDVIVFTKVDDDEWEGPVIDAIPLSELEGISSTETGNESVRIDSVHGHKKPEIELQRSGSFGSSKSRDSKKIKFWHSIQIRTAIDGYNSGRTYHLQASSAVQCAELVDKISAAAATAKNAKEAKTRFEKSQVRYVLLSRMILLEAIQSRRPFLPPQP